jgi:hypothetical protein
MALGVSRDASVSPGGGGGGGIQGGRVLLDGCKGGHLFRAANVVLLAS